MRAAPDDSLSFYRVDRAVNSNRASGPHRILEGGAPHLTKIAVRARSGDRTYFLLSSDLRQAYEAMSP